MFGAVKVNTDRTVYVGRGIALVGGSGYSHKEKGRDSWAHNIIIFGTDNTNNHFAKNKNHELRMIGKGTNQKLLGNKDIVAENSLKINMTEPNKTFVVSIHWNGDKSSFWVNGNIEDEFVAKKIWHR